MKGIECIVKYGLYGHLFPEPLVRFSVRRSVGPSEIMSRQSLHSSGNWAVQGGKWRGEESCEELEWGGGGMGWIEMSGKLMKNVGTRTLSLDSNTSYAR